MALGSFQSTRPRRTQDCVRRATDDAWAMALQDLTPQLRTRMSRVERLVGLFVVFAGLLMVAGFVLMGYQLSGYFLRRVA